MTVVDHHIQEALEVGASNFHNLVRILFKEGPLIYDAMTDPVRPGLQPISQLKAGPTISSSRSSALLSPNHQPLKRSPSALQTDKASYQDETPDGTSKKATAALIRRVLCPQTSSHGASSPQPLEELLPPLTSSNDIDFQLYALLAIIIKEFLYSWYAKITPDQALVGEIIQVVAHCTRALEQRIRKIDAIELVLDDIPALVEAHITCKTRLSQMSFLPITPVISSQTRSPTDVLTLTAFL